MYGFRANSSRHIPVSVSTCTEQRLRLRRPREAETAVAAAARRHTHRRHTWAFSRCTSTPRLPVSCRLGTSVLYGSFFLQKYADRNKTKYAAKICGIMLRSHQSHIHIKPTCRNGDSGCLCGKYAICTLLGNMRIKPRAIFF